MNQWKNEVSVQQNANKLSKILLEILILTQVLSMPFCSRNIRLIETQPWKVIVETQDFGNCCCLLKQLSYLLFPSKRLYPFGQKGEYMILSWPIGVAAWPVAPVPHDIERVCLLGDRWRPTCPLKQTQAEWRDRWRVGSNLVSASWFLWLPCLPWELPLCTYWLGEPVYIYIHFLA